VGLGLKKQSGATIAIQPQPAPGINAPVSNVSSRASFDNSPT